MGGKVLYLEVLLHRCEGTYSRTSLHSSLLVAAELFLRATTATKIYYKYQDCKIHRWQIK